MPLAAILSRSLMAFTVYPVGAFLLSGYGCRVPNPWLRRVLTLSGFHPQAFGPLGLRAPLA